MENNGKEKKEKTGWVAELISWVQVLVSAAVIAFVLTTFVIANIRCYSQINVQK